MRSLIVFYNLGFGFHWHLDLVNLCAVLETFKWFWGLELVYNFFFFLISHVLYIKRSAKRL